MAVRFCRVGLVAISNVFFKQSFNGWLVAHMFLFSQVVCHVASCFQCALACPSQVPLLSRATPVFGIRISLSAVGTSRDFYSRMTTLPQNWRDNWHIRGNPKLNEMDCVEWTVARTQQLPFLFLRQWWCATTDWIILHSIIPKGRSGYPGVVWFALMIAGRSLSCMERRFMRSSMLVCLSLWTKGSLSHSKQHQ